MRPYCPNWQPLSGARTAALRFYGYGAYNFM
jgi:hypothetical protein